MTTFGCNCGAGVETLQYCHDMPVSRQRVSVQPCGGDQPACELDNNFKDIEIHELVQY